MSRIKAAWAIVKQAASDWSNDQCTTLGAALAYYTVFSIAPLLVIAIAIAGWVFGEQASRGEIYRSIQGLMGPDGARMIESMVHGAAQKPHAGVIATIIGAITLMIGSSAVFSQIQSSLNMIWKVRPKPGKGLWAFLRQRLLSFSMVLAIGFVLLVSLLLSAGVAALAHYLGGVLPGGAVLWHLVNNVVSFAVIGLLFAAIFKVLPDVKLSWEDVTIGAVVTAALFTIGKFLIGLYLGNGSVANAYGAAGSFVLVLLWVYYSSLILFYGAEFTKVYSLRNGRKVLPVGTAEFYADHPVASPQPGQSIAPNRAA